MEKLQSRTPSSMRLNNNTEGLARTNHNPVKFLGNVLLALWMIDIGFDNCIAVLLLNIKGIKRQKRRHIKGLVFLKIVFVLCCVGFVCRKL